MDSEHQLTRYLTSHIILPPKLPQQVEDDRLELENQLLGFVEQTLSDFLVQAPSTHASAWNVVLRMIVTMRYVEKDGELQSDHLANQLRAIRVGDYVAVHLRAQNAGIVIHRQNEDSIIVETFEVSPTAAQVNGTLGRLRRTFPGLCVVIAWTQFSDTEFLHELSECLRQLNSGELTKDSKRALAAAGEPWDSPDPFMVSEFLMTILTVHGKRQKPSTLQKWTRDHALCEQVRKPERVWRRSPLWLVVRVASQMVLQRVVPEQQAHAQYKAFMLYLTAAVGSQALRFEETPDILHVIRAKLARRNFKIHSKGWDLEQFVADNAKNVITGLHGRLKTIWQAEQNDDVMPVPSLQGSQPSDADRALPLTNSLPELQQRIRSNTCNEDEKPSKPGLGSNAQESDTFPSLPQSGSWEGKLLDLADREATMVKKLKKMASGNGLKKMPQSRCSQLLTGMQAHFKAVQEASCSCPREMSATWLLSLEIWIALDRVCVEEFPLLGDYTTGIPKNFLHPLLLPKKEQLQRLGNIERYMESRQRKATEDATGLLHDDDHSSFAVRFFDQSKACKDFRIRVEKESERKRSKKQEEWNKKLKKKESMIRYAAELECTRNQIPTDNPEHAGEGCQHCIKLQEADDLKIKQLRHPLPEDENHLKAVIFEIKCPEYLLIWRDATWWILHELGRLGETVQPQPNRSTKLPLGEFKPLKSVIPEGLNFESRNISLTASGLESTKQIKLPEDFGQVYIKSGLQFRLYDAKHKCWLRDQTVPPSIKGQCTLKLPQGTYSNLDWASTTYQHDQNAAMANQVDRNRDLDFEQYMSFCELRAGERLQWPDILIELNDSHLQLEEEATGQLIFQSIWEAGGPHRKNRITRRAHDHLHDRDFCFKLLGTLDRIIDTARSSWKRQRTMMKVLIVLQRILSINPSSEVTDATINLLSESRRTCLAWCRGLRTRLEKITDDEDTSETELLLHRASLLCCFGYDVDEEHLDKVLNGNESVSNLIEARILTQTSRPQFDELPSDIRQLALWSTKSSHRLQPQLRKLVKQSSNGLHEAVSSFLDGDLLDDRWASSEDNGEKPQTGRWLHTRMMPRSRVGTPQVVQYDLLFGNLFIDKILIGKVREDFANHPLFCHVFGRGMMHSAASTLPGMQHQLLKTIDGNQFHIASRDDVLIIKVKTSQHNFEILDPKLFKGDLPDRLVENHVHWLDIDTRTVEFRPLAD
ncbi:MAG: hypothetical protein M1822_004971 [Bathelium mastoideum]|nr:MAG: hypothetical protein M1822_004971 [Bathelium mastoideum]